MFQTKTNHVCAIADKSSGSYLPVLSPFASKIAKARRRVHTWILAAEGNPHSIEFFRNTSRVSAARREHVDSGSWIIHPFSMFRLYYEMWMSLVFFVCLIYMPLHSGYEYLLGMALEEPHLTLSVLSGIDIIMNFLTGRCISKEDIVMKPGRIARNYIFGPHFICDVLSSLPPLHAYLNPDVERYFSCCLILKVVRTATFMQYVERTLAYFKVKGYMLLTVKICLLSILALHFVTCATYLLELMRIASGYPDTGLVGDKHNASQFYPLFIRYIYRSASLLLNIEVEKKYKPNAVTCLYALVFYIAGKILLSFIIVVLLDLIKTNNILEGKYYQMLSEVNSYMAANEFPTQVQKRMKIFYSYKYARKYINETKIEKYISEKLKKEIKYHECRKLVHSVNIFESLPQEIVEDILPYLKKEIFLSKDIIVKAGTSGDCMYFLESGTVTVLSPSGKEICHLQDGEYFGELCLMLQVKRTATVVALEMCQLYKLERKYFKKCLVPHPIVYNIIHQEARRRFIYTQDVERTFIKSVNE